MIGTPLDQVNVLTVRPWRQSSKSQQDRKSVLSFFKASDETNVMVCYLPEDERLADVLAAIGQRDYDAIHDIDRYSVETSSIECDAETCPVLKRVCEIVVDHKIKFSSVESESDDGTRGSCIRGGYGYVGPICHARNCQRELVLDSSELKSICKSCKHCRHGSADDRDDVTNRQTKEIGHGGIIAFVRKLFSRN